MKNLIKELALSCTLVFSIASCDSPENETPGNNQAKAEAKTTAPSSNLTNEERQTIQAFQENTAILLEEYKTMLATPADKEKLVAFLTHLRKNNFVDDFIPNSNIQITALQSNLSQGTKRIYHKTEKPLRNLIDKKEGTLNTFATTAFLALTYQDYEEQSQNWAPEDFRLALIQKEKKIIAVVIARHTDVGEVAIHRNSQGRLPIGYPKLDGTVHDNNKLWDGGWKEIATTALTFDKKGNPICTMTPATKAKAPEAHPPTSP